MLGIDHHLCGSRDIHALELGCVGLLVRRRSETFLSVLRGAVSKRGVALMGVCNVTPDSFSDGGEFLRAEDARARVDRLLADGADVIDIGGESTRPRSTPVSAKEQIERVLDVTKYAAHACARLDRPACVSIDTQSSEVARACLAAGAVVINDVSCCADAELARAVADAGAAYVIMHARGSMQKMAGFSVQSESAYRDVVVDVAREWKEAALRARDAGVSPDAIVMDPGLGYAKSARHSAELVKRLADLVASVDAPVAIGASRKSFLTLADPSASPAERLGASIVVALLAAERGVQMVRVHDVAVTRQALDAMRVWGPDAIFVAKAGAVVHSPNVPKKGDAHA